MTTLAHTHASVYFFTHARDTYIHAHTHAYVSLYTHLLILTYHVLIHTSADTSIDTTQSHLISMFTDVRIHTTHRFTQACINTCTNPYPRAHGAHALTRALLLS